MTCEKCKVCGLVLDNHDYVMLEKCTTGLMPSNYVLMRRVLRNDL